MFKVSEVNQSKDSPKHSSLHLFCSAAPTVTRFNLDIHDLVKDAFDKQDKTKTVDIFQVMAEAMNKNKTSQFKSDFSRLNFSNEEAKHYSPATMAAAKKFKKFLGNRLKPEPTFSEKLIPSSSSLNKENDNHIDFKYQSVTAPNSPYFNRGILSETSPKKESKEARTKQMINAAVIPCTITLKVPGDQKRTIMTSSKEPNRYSSKIRNSMSYMKEAAGMKNKEENGGLDTSNKISHGHLANNCDEEKRDGKIHKYSNYSHSDHGGDVCRQNQTMGSSQGKGVHPPGTDLACDKSSPVKDQNPSGESEMAALYPIHRKILERNAIRSSVSASAPADAVINASCQKLTSVRRPNQVTSGWI